MSLSLEATRILGSLWVVWRCEPRSAIRYHPHKRNNKPQHWSIKLSLLVCLSLSLFSLSVFHFRSAAFQEKHCLPGARGPFWNYHQPTNTSPNSGDRKKPGHHKTLACLLFFSLEWDLSGLIHVFVTRMCQVASVQVYLVKQELCRYNLCAWKSSLVPTQLSLSGEALSPHLQSHSQSRTHCHLVGEAEAGLEREAPWAPRQLSQPRLKHTRGEEGVFMLQGFHFAVSILSKVDQFWVWMLLRNVSP